MNSTKIILIALAFCLCILAVPVAALWANGNWVPEDTYNSCDYVVYDHQTDVTSCYRAYSAESDYKKTPDSMQGVLRGSVRCGYNLLTTEIGIRNDANPDGAKGEFKFFPILPDGRFGDTNGNPDINLIPGNFTLMVKDGNGGQPEYSHARISAGGISYPEREILGHAVSAIAEEVSVAPTQCTQKINDVTCKVQMISVRQWYDWKQYLHIDSDYDNLHYNALFGDPNVGTLKELRVVYKYEKFCPFGTKNDGSCRFGVTGQNLIIRSAQYGTFCGETKVPKGYLLKSVAENVDMDIHYST